MSYNLLGDIVAGVVEVAFFSSVKSFEAGESPKQYPFDTPCTVFGYVLLYVKWYDRRPLVSQFRARGVNSIYEGYQTKLSPWLLTHVHPMSSPLVNLNWMTPALYTLHAYNYVTLNIAGFFFNTAPKNRFCAKRLRVMKYFSEI